MLKFLFVSWFRNKLLSVKFVGWILVTSRKKHLRGWDDLVILAWSRSTLERTWLMSMSKLRDLLLFGDEILSKCIVRALQIWEGMNILLDCRFMLSCFERVCSIDWRSQDRYIYWLWCLHLMVFVDWWLWAINFNVFFRVLWEAALVIFIWVRHFQIFLSCWRRNNSVLLLRSPCRLLSQNRLALSSIVFPLAITRQVLILIFFIALLFIFRLLVVILLISFRTCIWLLLFNKWAAFFFAIKEFLLLIEVLLNWRVQLLGCFHCSLGGH